MGTSNFSALSVAGVPVLPNGAPATTGKVFFVSNRSGDSGSDGNDGLTAERPFSTLAKAVTQCSSGRGDVIIVMPGHAETITTTVTPIAGSAIIGLGWGANRPTFTGSGAIDVFTISAANVILRNIRIAGASANVTALIELSGADFTCEDVEFLHAATPLDAVTLSSGGARFKFVRCSWRGTAAGPDNCIIAEASSVGIDGYIKDCRAHYNQSSGLDESFIRADNNAFQGLIVDGLTVVGIDATVVDFNSSSAAVGDGLIANVNAVGSGALTIANAIDLGGFSASNVYLTDSAAARGTNFPTTTPS